MLLKPSSGTNNEEIEMFLNKKNRIMELINTTLELIDYTANSGNIEYFSDIRVAIESLEKTFENETKDEENFEIIINELKITINYFRSININDLTYEDLEQLKVKVLDIEKMFLREVKVKLNIAFMPYNITMWDSLESIYDAAKNDVDCVAKVIPIPYYDVSQEHPEFKYDGEKFSEIVDIVSFDEYNLEVENPDIIYIHNIYDYGNILTRVHPNYFTSNLKKYTDMLVYSPYCIPSFLSDEQDHSFTFDAVGADNIDKFISAGDFVKKQGEIRGVEKEKIFNVGCPKFDSIIKHINDDVEVPEKWIKKADGRKSVLFVTSISYFIEVPNENNSMYTNVMDNVISFMTNLAAYRANDFFVIWRPHPLTRLFIKRNAPFLLEWFDEFCNKEDLIHYLVIDKNASYLPAFKMSDAMFTDSSSIVYPYLMLNKKLIFRGSDEVFVKNKIKIDYKKIDFQTKIGRNIDPIKIIMDIQRTGELSIDNKFLSKFYKNLDGTIGEKIHYNLKSEILVKSKH